VLITTTTTSPNPTVRLGVTDLSFHRATGAVIAAVLERMGFRVERRYAPHEENFERLRDDEIDMIASAWIPFSHGAYKRRVEEVVATRELGLHYEPYALWGVPEYVPEADVASVEDLLKPQVRARMRKLIPGAHRPSGAAVQRGTDRQAGPHTPVQPDRLGARLCRQSRRLELRRGGRAMASGTSGHRRCLAGVMV
jgi:hypothetical protein